jgi:hypothetical protein
MDEERSGEFDEFDEFDGREEDWEEIGRSGVVEAGSFESDWDLVMSVLPQGWQEKAIELGAVQRLRRFSNVPLLLRVLMLHLAGGHSLRITAEIAAEGGLVNVSDVALLKRLRSCGPWFQWMTRELAAAMATPLVPMKQLEGRRIRLIDGSTVSEPGATGSTWRLHYSFDLRSLSCDEVRVTETAIGESLTRFEVAPGDVLVADRSFANRSGLRHVVKHGGDALLRMNLTNLPLENENGKPLAILPFLRKIEVGQACDLDAWMRDDEGRIRVRVCAYKKTAAQTLKAQQSLLREAAKKKRATRPDTIEGCGYVIVVTTLRNPSAQEVLELYRRRWQIELAFKRLKSILQLGHLRKTDPDGAKAWLQGKLLVACIIETLIQTAERFSPWGYAVDEYGALAAALRLA